MTMLPVAPELVMNPAAQDIALAIGTVGMAAALIVGLRVSIRYASPLPFLFPIAGMFDVVLEPIICRLGHCVHPQIGQITLFTANDRPIPVHAALLYGLYYGPVWIFLYTHAAKHGLTERFLWNVLLGLFAAAFVFTIAPVHYGLWYHYGYQALRLWNGGSPLFFPAINLAPVFLGFACVMKYRVWLTGVRSLVVIPLTQTTAVMAHLGAGWPYYNVLNASASHAAIQIAGLASILLGAMIVAACIRSLSRDCPETPPVRRQHAKKKG